VGQGANLRAIANRANPPHITNPSPRYDVTIPPMRRALIVLLSLAATLAAQPSLTSHPCTEAATLRSPALATTATQVQFANGAAASVRVYWIDPAGQRKLYSTLLPGTGYTQSTFAAHVWLVTDVADGCLALFVASADPVSIAKVGADGPPPNPCLLRSTAQFSMGPTDYSDRLRPAGSLNALLLFVDFSDAPGRGGPGHAVQYARAALSAVVRG
jgi:hypothetical protein